MRVIQGGRSEATPTDAVAEGLRTTIDVAAALRFLRGQAAALTDALAAPERPRIVEAVLAMHEAAHGTWVRLIADVDRAGAHEIAEHLAALYSFHGKIVGSLERKPERLLDGDIAKAVRRVLTRHLEEQTDEAVRALGERSIR